MRNFLIALLLANTVGVGYLLYRVERPVPANTEANADRSFDDPPRLDPLPDYTPDRNVRALLGFKGIRSGPIEAPEGSPHGVFSLLEFLDGECVGSLKGWFLPQRGDERVEALWGKVDGKIKVACNVFTSGTTRAIMDGYVPKHPEIWSNIDAGSSTTVSGGQRRYTHGGTELSVVGFVCSGVPREGEKPTPVGELEHAMKWRRHVVALAVAFFATKKEADDFVCPN